MEGCKTSVYSRQNYRFAAGKVPYAHGERCNGNKVGGSLDLFLFSLSPVFSVPGYRRSSIPSSPHRRVVIRPSRWLNRRTNWGESWRLNFECMWQSKSNNRSVEGVWPFVWRLRLWSTIVGLLYHYFVTLLILLWPVCKYFYTGLRVFIDVLCPPLQHRIFLLQTITFWLLMRHTLIHLSFM